MRSSPLQITHGFGRRAGAVAVDERADDPPAEDVLEVERQVRNAELVRDRARAEHGRGRAAAACRVGVAVRPQLQRHRDHLRPALALAQRRDGRVDAAAERDEHALARRAAAPRARRPSRRRRPAPGAVRRRRARPRGDPGGRCPPSTAAMSSVPSSAASSTVASLGQLGDRRTRGARGRAALGVEADPLDPVRVEGDRDPDQVAARQRRRRRRRTRRASGSPRRLASSR